MSYNRKQWERKQRYKNKGKRVPRSVWELYPLPLTEMPGSLARQVLERTEKSARQARNAA